MTIKLSFRSTTAGATDNAGETKVISATDVASADAEQYPIPRDTITFGWISATVSTRDRVGSSDPRFAGCHFNTANQDTFQIDLPAPGVYDIRLACGDYANTNIPVAVTVHDNNGSALFTVSGTTSTADRFIDSVGAEYSSANWPGSNTAQRKTFATTTLKMKVGDNAAPATGFIAHVQIDAVVAATPTKPMWPMSFF